jgi:hypothetical protein
MVIDQRGSKVFISMPINPAFYRYPAEAAIIGRLLAAFGELEFSVCNNAARATGLGEIVWITLYRIRSTRSRLDAADALMRPLLCPTWA